MFLYFVYLKFIRCIIVFILTSLSLTLSFCLRLLFFLLLSDKIEFGLLVHFSRQFTTIEIRMSIIIFLCQIFSICLNKIEHTMYGGAVGWFSKFSKRNQLVENFVVHLSAERILYTYVQMLHLYVYEATGLNLTNYV